MVIIPSLSKGTPFDKGKMYMWEKGVSKEKGFYYWILKCDPITASRLYSALCTHLGRVSTTKCINDKVNWLDSEYDFII